jgi:hypothetical protein
MESADGRLPSVNRDEDRWLDPVTASNLGDV